MSGPFWYSWYRRLTAVVVTAMIPLLAIAQPQPQKPVSYAVATIKPSDPNRSVDDNEIGYDDGSFTFTAENMSIKGVIKFAYDLSLNADQQVQAGPSWAGTQKFNIVVKPEPEAIAELQKLTEKQRDAQIEEMVRKVLAERFDLVTLKQTRLLPVYNLKVSSGGPRLKISSIPENSPEAGSGQTGQGFIKGIACPIDSLGGFLEAVPEVRKRLVIDETGLAGSYDFTLRWTPDPTIGVAPPSVDSGVKQDQSAPSFFTAIQEQLGLKLIPAKGPVDVIIIDHVEMPSQN